MRVAHCCISPQQRLLLANPGAKLFGTEFFEFIASAFGQRSGSVQCRNLCWNSPCGARRVLNTWMAIDDYVTDILQELGGTIPSRLELEQFWRFVDEPRRAVAGEKSWIVDEMYK